MKSLKSLVFAGSLMLMFPLWAWNAVGHRMVAQIAYDHMSPAAKQRFNQTNHALDKIYRPQSFVNSAVWLDYIRYEGDVPWYDTMHYVNLYFSTDGTPLPTLQKINAVWAIEHAIKTLEAEKSNDFDKGIALRILIHVVGDLHQPMHGVTRVSRTHPNGDLGGNLFPLGPNPIANNLHGYWDEGAGLFKTKSYLKPKQLANKAALFEKQYPCNLESTKTTPSDWLHESHQIATNFAYHLTPNQKPGKTYQMQAQDIIQKRVAQAGCRLALQLNKMAEND